MTRMYQFKVFGVVQGVGFRPYIHNACTTLGLLGYVQNVGDGVIVVVNDDDALLRIFNDIPEHMRIDSYTVEETRGDYDNFTIKESAQAGVGGAEIPPDLFLCAECEKELKDPNNRRFGYFFITCTACGPRFTIARGAPFDRRATTMQDFAMCGECKKEYEDPSDRRYHAETIACTQCGPSLALYENGKPMEITDDEKFKYVASKIAAGETVAIKGIGGFHLACALNEKSIEQLDRLRNRGRKPYAVLCGDINMARDIAVISKTEEDMLLHPGRPIVLLKKKGSSPALFAASELSTIGIMLPYTPIHHLLFRHYNKPIIMTSANRASEPISTDRREQFVSIVLDHDRQIQNAADDSVIKPSGDRPFFIRRSRGSVPRSLQMPIHTDRTILAVGAEMNNTFALLNRNRLTISQYMGNTANPVSFERYKKAVDDFLRYTNTSPEVIACDLHPEYRTSLYAKELSVRLGVPLVSIQHHRAHISAVALEHKLTDVVGIACDGLGYGDDGKIWGGEVFSGGVRIGHLEEQPQLGGDAATRYPHRMLYGILRKFLPEKEARGYIVSQYSDPEIRIFEKQLQEGFNTPLTTSTGRILDAAAALLGFCGERTYDGRPAMLLETNSTTAYDLEPVIKENILYTTPLFEFLIHDLHKDRSRLAATVERYIAEGLYEIGRKEKKPMVFAGGCAYNTTMSTFMLEKKVLMNKEIPPGDGGISAGQIYAAMLADTRDDISRRN